MDPYWIIKWVHVLGGTVLFGAGLGIAFFLYAAHRGGDVATIAGVSKLVVRADWTFTLTAGIFQPITGVALIYLAGYHPLEGWLLAVYALYLLALACWIPVVGLQLRVRRMAVDALAANAPLPPDYFLAMRKWFWLGWPAFTALLIIYWLMLTKGAV